MSQNTLTNGKGKSYSIQIYDQYFVCNRIGELVLGNCDVRNKALVITFLF